MVPRPTQRAAAPQALRVPPLHPAVSDARQGDGAQYDPQVRAARLLRPYGMVGDRRPCGPSRRADHRGARDAELHPRDESGLCGLARASRLLHVCPAYPGGGDMDVRRLGIATVARSDWGHTGELRHALRCAWVHHPARALGEGVPIIQLHAGESTPPAFDDDVRHFISRIAALRLCCHDLHRQRLLTMGIPEETIHVTGAPGLDRLTRPHMARSVLARHLRLDAARRWALVILHPTTRATVDAEAEYRQCVAAIGDRQALWFTPCQDTGRERYTRDRMVDCVTDAAWRALLYEADVLIGNSSALVIEAPFVGLRTVEIGVRQQGRERVPYGDGQSVPRIVRLLQEWTP